MHDDTHHEGAYAEDGYQRRHVFHAVHLLQEQTADDEGQAVAGIAHTHGEEQQEEDGDIRGRVELVVVRTAVHVGE